MALSKIELGYTIMFLEQLSEEQSNAGCNDLVIKLDSKEARDFVSAAHADGGDESYEEIVENAHNPKKKQMYVMDTTITDYLIHRLKQELVKRK